MNQTSSIPQSLNLNSGSTTITNTTDNTTTNNNSSSSLNNNNNNNDSQSNLKRAFDLEPNPFEQSFATNDDENTQNIDPKNLNSNKNYPLKLTPLSQQGKNNTTITTNTTTNTNTNANPINKSNTLPQGSPPILTPGGTRRVHNNVLPPLPMLSPGSTSIPGTPMWLQGSTGLSSSNLNFNFLPSLNRQPSTNNTNTNINSSSGAAIKNGNSDTNGNSSSSSSASSSSSSNNNNNNITNTSTNINNIPNSNTTNSNSNNSNNNNNNNNTNSISIPNSSGSNNNPAAYNQFVMNLKKTGLTPFESSLRTGLTPSIPGVPPPLNSNPSANTISMFLGLPSGPMTPTGFSSLLGITSTTPNKTPIPGISSSNQHNHPQQQPNLNGINTTNTTNSVNMQLKLPEPGSLHNSNPVKLEQPYHVVPGSSNSSSTTISASVSAQNTPDLKIKNGNSLTTTTTATSSLDIPQPITTTPSTATNKNKRGKKTDTSVSKSNKRKLSTDKKSANKTTSKKSKTSKFNGNNYNYDEDNDDDDNDDNDDNDDENDDGENSSKGQTQEEKRKNFLERNRVAASKCRQRKKQMVEKMHVDLQFYSSQYESLNQQVRTLRDQVIGLRSVLFAHKDCPNLLDQVGGYDNLNIYLNNADFVISHSAQQQQQQQQQHQQNQQQQE